MAVLCGDNAGPYVQVPGAAPSLMNLPTELRLEILAYTLAFAKPLRKFVPGTETTFPPRHCALLCTCKQLYAEARPLLYDQNTFIYDRPYSFPPSICPLIRCIKVELRLAEYTSCWYEANEAQNMNGWSWYLDGWPFPPGSVRKLIVCYADSTAKGLERGFARLKIGGGNGWNGWSRAEGHVLGELPFGPYKPYGVDMQEIVIEGVSDALAAAILKAAASMR